jgi:hypothetical protein
MTIKQFENLKIGDIVYYNGWTTAILNKIDNRITLGFYGEDYEYGYISVSHLNVSKGKPHYLN